jgi:phage shock protein A
MSIWNIFSRGSKIAEAKANSALDRAEDPSEMTEQAIRDLNVKLTKAMEAQATFKSMIIQLQSAEKKSETDKATWLEKATKLQAHIDADPTQAATIEPLMITALQSSNKSDLGAKSATANIAIQQKKYDALVEQIKGLREMINETEEHLALLKTRQIVAEASVSINKELGNFAGLDSTKSLIERMEAKVAQKESLSDAYAGIDADSATDETKINNILKTETATSSADLLASFRANLQK